MSRRARMIAATALVAVAPAGSAQAAATVTVDQPCYSPGDTMAVSGTGFTPGGQISLSFRGRSLGIRKATAGPAGELTERIPIGNGDAEALIPEGRSSGPLQVAAVDDTGAEAGSPDAFALTETRLSHFGVRLSQDADAIVPRRRLTLQVAGFTGLAGRTAYLHYVRGGTRRASVRLGALRGACGDTLARLPRAFPAPISRAGAWTLAVTTSRTNPRAFPRIVIDARIRRGDLGG